MTDSEQDGAGAEVLVVDDDPGTRDTIVDILAVAGISARAVASAAEALACYQAAPSDVALLDYRLPDATGLELASRLKRLDADLPILVLTGNASLETAVAAVSLVDEYLTKPVLPERLLRAVRSGLARRRLVSENRELLGRLRQANATLEAKVGERTQELRADRERLAEAQRIARIGSWELDIASAKLSCSTELLRLYGLDDDGPLTDAAQLLRHLPDSDRKRVEVEVLAAMETSRLFAVEIRVFPPGGDMRWLRVQGRVVASPDGTPQRLVGTSQDITDRKRADEQFRDLLESAPDAMVIVSEDGAMVLVNRQTERLFGWSRQQLIGQTVEMLLPERFREVLQRHRASYQNRADDRGADVAIEVVARRADGSELPVEISLGPVQTDSGLLISAAIRDITERKRAEAALAHQALHDALTGLPNRVLLADRLDQALAGASRSGRGLAVLFLDVDRFKLINDSRGHAAGDDLLVRVAHRLEEAVRPSDTVARFGGDEFVIVGHDAGHLNEALHLADRVSTALRQPFRIAGEDVFLSVSIGIAVSGGELSAEALLRNSDAAMYRAKDQGRNRCEFFDETMRTEAAARLELQTALHWAVHREEMGVHYQPLVRIDSLRPVGAEALVRWNHPQRGIVGASAFVPLAEEAGLIGAIGEGVLRQSVRDCAGWQQPGGVNPLTVAVNLSAHQLRHPGLVGQVRAALHDYGLDPAALCLELTESVLMEDVDQHTRKLLDLRSLGVGLAIDDFGTGYSSLTYLKRFPVDVVKIDRSFVAGLGADLRDTAIVRSIIDLAHALNLKVVAEGIERPEQLQLLRNLGCDYAQGFLFSCALPEPSFTSWLTDNPGISLAAGAARRW